MYNNLKFFILSHNGFLKVLIYLCTSHDISDSNIWLSSKDTFTVKVCSSIKTTPNFCPLLFARIHEGIMGCRAESCSILFIFPSFLIYSYRDHLSYWIIYNGISTWFRKGDHVFIRFIIITYPEKLVIKIIVNIMILIRGRNL